MIIATLDGHEVQVEIQISTSSRVQNIDGSMETHLVINPVIVGGPPRGPDGGEPLPIPKAA